MSFVAVVGDCATTTAVALAATWPAEHAAVIIEADRTGGSLAGWLDTPNSPSLSTIVAHAPTLSPSPSAAWFTIDAMTHTSASGLRFIAAPVRSREASRAIGEADSSVFPLLASLPEPTMIADCGRHHGTDPLPAALSLATSIVVTHRQRDTSAGAGAVRLERLAELIHDLAPLDRPIDVAVIGGHPFDVDEIHRFVAGDADTVRSHAVADDDLSAAVLAGRTGVSARRLARLPLLRSMRGVARSVQQSAGLDEPTAAGWLDASRSGS